MDVFRLMVITSLSFHLYLKGAKLIIILDLITGWRNYMYHMVNHCSACITDGKVYVIIY